MKNKKIKTPLPLRVVSWTFPKVEAISQWLANRWFVNLFFTPVRYKTPASEIEIMESASKHEVRIADNNVQVYEWGEGKPVLFVHGWMGRGTQFKRFVPIFNAAGYKVVSFDAIGHGKSEGKKSHIMYFAETVNALADKYDFHSVVGHSIGGVAVMHALIKDRFTDKLVMIGSPTMADHIIGAFLRSLRASKRVLTYFNQYVESKFGKSFDEYSAKHIVKDLDDVDILLIHDEDDREVTIENPYVILNKYPQSKLMTTKGLGHTRILKDEAVIDACLQFTEKKKELISVA
ncbi:alpha/beta hydrolase [Fulvivirga sp. RKSG066]|uniref:alpha/beta fold hydrolase n=1 Tax=Fulvivirga aurantia TaxID=2529383 RepID=UPI0012BC8CFA|nr:alpha/beta hydrolase [Fulvivirga aurantia]MTI22199.1 alpha/beta hydrolase [Fulvivirga aurantia]